MNNRILRVFIYSAHVLLVFGYYLYYERYTYSYINYSDLFGADESYWLDAAYCDWSASTEQCYLLYQNLFPLLLSVLIAHDVELAYLFLFKNLFYIFSVFVLTKILWRYRYSNVLIFEFFLLINPYVQLLHISLLRDDIIVSLVLLLCSFLYELQNENKLNLKKIAYLIALILLLFGLRFGFGVISLSIVACFFIVKYLDSRLIIKSLLFILPVLSYLLFHEYMFEMSIDKFIINLRKLLYSPLPQNVLTGKIVEMGTDTSLLPLYSLIFPLFSFLVTVRVFVSAIYSRYFLFHVIRRHIYVFLLSVGFLLPYIVSSLDVAGPRQSLPSSVILFYIFGARYLNINHVYRFRRTKKLQTVESYRD